MQKLFDKVLGSELFELLGKMESFGKYIRKITNLFWKQIASTRKKRDTVNTQK